MRQVLELLTGSSDSSLPRRQSFPERLLRLRILYACAMNSTCFISYSRRTCLHQQPCLHQEQVGEKRITSLCGCPVWCRLEICSVSGKSRQILCITAISARCTNPLTPGLNDLPRLAGLARDLSQWYLAMVKLRECSFAFRCGTDEICEVWQCSEPGQVQQYLQFCKARDLTRAMGREINETATANIFFETEVWSIQPLDVQNSMISRLSLLFSLSAFLCFSHG